MVGQVHKDHLSHLLASISACLSSVSPLVRKVPVQRLSRPPKIKQTAQSVVSYSQGSIRGSCCYEQKGNQGAVKVPSFSK